MKPAKYFAASFLPMLVLPTPAVATQYNAVARDIIDVIGSAITNGRLRKVIAEISSPLQYEGRLGPPDKVNKNDPRNLDVAGIRLGMTSREAKRVLQSAGYEVTDSFNTIPTYDTMVRSEWQNKYGIESGAHLRFPDGLTGQKQGQYVRVSFIALPDGVSVNKVEYSADEELVSEEAFEEQIAHKYGEPSNGTVEEQRWCIILAPQCEELNGDKYPVLVANARKHSIVLSGNDSDREKALEARFQADVARKRPMQIKPDF